jgi:hypothetical protein
MSIVLQRWAGRRRRVSVCTKRQNVGPHAPIGTLARSKFELNSTKYTSLSSEKLVYLFYAPLRLA